MTSRSRLDVEVLDLRGRRGDDPLSAFGLVVVVDDVATLAGHTAVFQALVSANEVHHLVCVIVGEPGERGDGVLLEVPGPLIHDRSTLLWVGDQHGVWWSPADNHPLPVKPTFPSGLDRLVEALRLPEVFHHVQQTVSGFVGTVASPGVVLVSGGVDVQELAAARAMVVQRLTAYDPHAAVPPPLADPASFAHDGEPAAAVLGGRVLGERNRAQESVRAATQTAATLPSWSALFRRSLDLAPPGRPGQVIGGQVRTAARDAETYRVRMAGVLHAVDGHLRVGRPAEDEVTQVGVRPPTEVNRGFVAERVAGLVQQAGRNRYSMTTLAVQLRHAAAAAAPQGCTAVAAALADGPSITRDELPPFRRLPLWGWTAPLILLTTFVVALLPFPGWIGPVLSVVFALSWFGAGWFLLARRPDDDGVGEQGFPDTVRRAAAVYGVPGVVGVVTGVLVVDLLRDIVPETLWPSVDVAWAVSAGAVVLYIGVVAASWPSAARSWVRVLRLGALSAELGDVMETAESGIRAEWLPAQRRRAVSEAFTEAAAALEETSEALGTSIPEGAGPRYDAGGTPYGLDRIVMDELLDVVGTDLVAVCQEALAPAWKVLAAGRRHPAGSYTDSALRVLRRYHDHVVRYGLLVTPPFVEDTGPRDRLLARRWTDSAAEEALRVQSSDEMEQLCSARGLNWIDGQSPARLVRFAPRSVEPVLAVDRVRNRAILGNRPTWTGAGETAGTIRLVPLRDGAIGRGAS